MTTPDQYSAAMAADPTTAPQTLADIAAQRPDLRAAVAGNPSTYPGLLDWLRGLGDPAVDAALAARVAAPPVTPPAPGFPPPGQVPAHETPVYQTPGYQTPGQAPAYQAPATAYTGGGAPASGGRKKWPWILGIVLLVLVGLGIGAFFLLKSLFGSVIEYGKYGSDDALDRLYDLCDGGDMAACDQLYMESPLGSEYEEFGDTCGGTQAGGDYCDVSSQPEPEPTEDPAVSGGGSYGEDPALDALWDACAGGDMAACDQLYMDSPLGSEYEEFGDTCGGTQAGGSFCDAAATEESPAPLTGGTYGDDPALDALWDGCEAGDMAACDTLFMDSPIDSEYESFGDTCGGRQEAGTDLWCES